MEIKNQTVLVTGGTSGIGLEFVKQLIRMGAKVLVTGRNIQALGKTKSLYPAVEIFQSDVSKAKDIEKLFHDVTEYFPELSIIINNAGIMRLLDLRDQSNSIENIIQEINVNLSGLIQMNHQFLPHLLRRKNAAIVNVSSAIAFMAYSSAPVYSASKAGVHAYTKALRLQLENTSVKVFEVIPPGVKTNLQNDWVLQPNPGQMMEADKMVRQAIKGLLKDKEEITPGLAGIVKSVSRIAPGFIERNLGHREFKKFQRQAQLARLQAPQ